MTSPLESLRQLGHLHAEASDAKEFAALKRSGFVRLADAEKVSNSLESRFDLAYSASHALSLAALRYTGYRSAKRYVVFQALPHTLGLGPEVWRVLAKVTRFATAASTKAISTSTSDCSRISSPRARPWRRRWKGCLRSPLELLIGRESPPRYRPSPSPIRSARIPTASA